MKAKGVVDSPMQIAKKCVILTFAVSSLLRRVARLLTGSLGLAPVINTPTRSKRRTRYYDTGKVYLTDINGTLMTLPLIL